MLMTAALHMDSSHGHGPSPSSYTSPPPPPWLLADDDNTHRRDQLLMHDFAASSAPSPAPATTASALPNDHHQSLRPAAARRVSKRRPRPSRKLPTTYIAADPASFRRIVQQVTGADDLPVPPPPPGTLCRPAPSRAAGAPGALPTLDTSAFLLAGAGAAPRSRAEASGGFAVMEQGQTGSLGGGGAPNCHDYSGSCGGFPTSWDHPLF